MQLQSRPTEPELTPREKALVQAFLKVRRWCPPADTDPMISDLHEADSLVKDITGKDGAQFAITT